MHCPRHYLERYRSPEDLPHVPFETNVDEDLEIDEEQGDHPEDYPDRKNWSGSHTSPRKGKVTQTEQNTVFTLKDTRDLKKFPREPFPLTKDEDETKYTWNATQTKDEHLERLKEFTPENPYQPFTAEEEEVEGILTESMSQSQEPTPIRPKNEEQEIPMADTTKSNENGKEVAPPTPFNGDRTKVNIFIKECVLYFQGHPEKYKDQKQRTLTALSYLKDGDAVIWKDQYLEQKLNNATYKFDVDDWKKFVEEFKEAFSQQDAVQNAVFKLSMLRQGNKRIEQHNIKFNLLVGQAQIKTDAEKVLLLETYKRSIHPRVLC